MLILNNLNYGQGSKLRSEAHEKKLQLIKARPFSKREATMRKHHSTDDLYGFRGDVQAS